jgi:hypothetical protein
LHISSSEDLVESWLVAQDIVQVSQKQRVVWLEDRPAPLRQGQTKEECKSKIVTMNQTLHLVVLVVAVLLAILGAILAGHHYKLDGILTQNDSESRELRQK